MERHVNTNAITTFENIKIASDAKIKTAKIAEEHKKKISELSSVAPTYEARKAELNTKYERKQINADKVIRAKMIKIYPNSAQRATLKLWFAECSRVYNKCVDLYNENPSNFPLNFKKSKLIVFSALYPAEQDKGCPYDILTDEVKTFCANVKSCLSNLAGGHIEGFKMKPKNTSVNQCIGVPKTAVKKGSFYPSYLGRMSGLDAETCECDSRVSYNHARDNYFMFLPQYREKTIIADRADFVALDPGERIFQTYYSPSEWGKIGEDSRGRILKYESKIRKFQRILSKMEKDKCKSKTRGKIKNKINRAYCKIKNIVKEMHNQTCNFLCKKFDTILIPEFKTQGMVRRDGKKKIKATVSAMKTNDAAKSQFREYSKKVRLTGRVKFVLNMQSHYKFRQQLLAKAEEYGCRVEVVGEEYTSQCCTFCGFLSSTYSNRIKHCDKCASTINRDLNGARNILLKNYKKIIRL